MTAMNHSETGPCYWLLAELTYRCPLHCAFCYNPVDYSGVGAELDTAAWLSVLDQARAMGAVQLGLSGGEPLLRPDLEEVVAHAHKLGFYINLLTSGVGLKPERLMALKEAGLDHIQLSFQDSTRELNDFLSNTRTFDLKRNVAQMIKQAGYPMVMNCVMHRYNLPHIEQIMDMAVEIGAEYLELANTQYYGWALKNRHQLLPTTEQLAEAEACVQRKREQLGDQCQILFVVPDYFEDRPKRCMNGWGNVFLVVAPDGAALPCHAARDIPNMHFPNVREEPLRDIWYDSPLFNAYRGTDWMQEPCRSCPEKDQDLGGCRCQALMLTGDARNADPVCSKSPHHHLISDAVLLARNDASRTQEQPIVFRRNPDREVRRPRVIAAD